MAYNSELTLGLWKASNQSLAFNSGNLAIQFLKPAKKGDLLNYIHWNTGTNKSSIIFNNDICHMTKL